MFSTEDYLDLAASYAAAIAPPAVFDAVRDLIGIRLGYGLLTMLILTPKGDEVQRIYTTDPSNFPLAGRERLGASPLGQHVFVEQKPYLGPDRQAIRWAFEGDFEVIARLGLGATMNIPVTGLGNTLGAINILDKEGKYTNAHLVAAASLAPYLSLPFQFYRGNSIAT